MNPLAFLSPYKLLIEIVLIGSLAAGVLYGIHQFLEHERDIGRNEVRAEWNAQKAADKLASDKLEKGWRDLYDAAINQGSQNAQALRAAAAVAGNANGGLLNTISKLNEQLATAPAETARKHAAAYQTLFAKCVGEYRAMGEVAQGHANDAKTLSDAWPK